MTKEQTLEILTLLSAMESWSFSMSRPLPDYLHDRLSSAIEVLSKEVLNGGTKGK